MFYTCSYRWPLPWGSNPLFVTYVPAGAPLPGFESFVFYARSYRLALEREFESLVFVARVPIDCPPWGSNPAYLTYDPIDWLIPGARIRGVLRMFLYIGPLSWAWIFLRMFLEICFFLRPREAPGEHNHHRVGAAHGLWVPTAGRRCPFRKFLGSRRKPLGPPGPLRASLGGVFHNTLGGIDETNTAPIKISIPP